eukprot:4785567-Amphidinium_carterae.2
MLHLEWLVYLELQALIAKGVLGDARLVYCAGSTLRSEKSAELKSATVTACSGRSAAECGVECASGRSSSRVLAARRLCVSGRSSFRVLAARRQSGGRWHCPFSLAPGSSQLFALGFWRPAAGCLTSGRGLFFGYWRPAAGWLLWLLCVKGQQQGRSW